MTIYEDARYQIQWHLDNGRLVGAVDLILAAIAAGEAAEAKLAEAEQGRRENGEAAAHFKRLWEDYAAKLSAAETREKAMREALEEARYAVLRSRCSHDLVCADQACREGNHDHENYDEDGWSCDQECPCSPACLGYGADVCEVAMEARVAVAAIDAALAAGKDTP